MAHWYSKKFNNRNNFKTSRVVFVPNIKCKYWLILEPAKFSHLFQSFSPISQFSSSCFALQASKLVSKFFLFFFRLSRSRH